MSALETHNEVYIVRDELVPVTWQPYNFTEDVQGIRDPQIRDALIGCGVMFIPAAIPPIRVSKFLPLDEQGLSALHEELCMIRKTEGCTDVEATVLGVITDNELRERFISTRLRMFGALCMLKPDNTNFAGSLQLLQETTARQ